MSNYFMQFQVLGEVAGFLLLEKPKKRLPANILTQARDLNRNGQCPYPCSTCFSIFDDNLIAAVLETLSVGDTIEATGTFLQTNYVSHETSYIDSTFHLLDFGKFHKNVGALQLNGRRLEPAPGALIH